MPIDDTFRSVDAIYYDALSQFAKIGILWFRTSYQLIVRDSLSKSMNSPVKLTVLILFLDEFVLCLLLVRDSKKIEKI